jgi:flagellar biosynthesis/type III secretory pathway M-ring protein FliF/YscJ
MAPQHIDDLPRHEEPRQLMLGLIDDLPEERRGVRQLMMMWGLGLAVVLALFVVLVWVTAPNGPPG